MRPALALAWLSLTALVVLAGPASAQSQGAAAPTEPRFDIRRFVVEGASLLTAEDIEAAVSAYTGQGKDFADVQRAAVRYVRSFDGCPG